MTLQTLILDPNAATYSGDQMISAINGATGTISRSNSVAAVARPIQANEITSANIVTGSITSGLLAAGVAKTSLDAMSDAARGYIKTNPTSGQFRIVSQERTAAGKVQVTYDDQAV